MLKAVHLIENYIILKTRKKSYIEMDDTLVE